MSIRMLGDIHGMYRVLENCVDDAIDTGNVSAIIQVGDFGWYPNRLNFFNKYHPEIPVYFIEGNHEDHEYLLNDLREVTEVYQNIFFIPRGTVLELEGRRIACMGGAASIDKDWRIANGRHWSPSEQITMKQAHLFDGVEKPDIFVTHTPPQSVIDKEFEDKDKLRYGVSMDWTDPSAAIIETLWRDWGCPMNFSGHFHQSRRGENYQILDINEHVDI